MSDSCRKYELELRWWVCRRRARSVLRERGRLRRGPLAAHESWRGV